MKDKVEITVLSRLLIEQIKIARKKNGVFINQDDDDIVELALLTVMACGFPNFQPGGMLAYTHATAIGFGFDKKSIIVLLRRENAKNVLVGE